MAQSLRVLLFNADDSYSSELRGRLLRVPGLKIVAELDEPSLLPQAVGQFAVDIVVVHLDPNVDHVIEIMRQVLEANAGLAAFALSEHTEGDVVLRAMRAGFREFLIKPLTDEELDRALAKIERVDAGRKEPGKLIAVIGSAGGVGATTIAANLAVELSTLIETPGRVALVDLDFRFGQAATILDLQAQFTIADLVDTHEQIETEMLNKAMVEHDSGVRVLARPHAFQQADSITAAHCASVLTALVDTFDYVVVDGPSRYDGGGQTVIDSADHSLLVVQLLVTAVRNADRICRELAQSGFNLDRLHLVCNRVDCDSGFLDAEQVERTIGRPMFATIPDDWKAVSSAINIGQPLKTSWGRSKARQAVVSLAQKLHAPSRQGQPSAHHRGGLLGRLLGGSRKVVDSGSISGAPHNTAPEPA